MTISSKVFIPVFEPVFTRVFGDQSVVEGGIAFEDNFFHGSDGDDLKNTQPDTRGINWLELFSDSATFIRIGATFGDIKGGTLDNNTGIVLHSNFGTPTFADVDIEITFTGLATFSNFPIYIIARYIDGNNFIALRLANGSTLPTLHKIVGGTVTTLATSTVQHGSSSTVKLQLRGSVWRVFIDSVQGVAVAETDLSVVGNSGLGWGDIEDQFSGDGINAETIINQYILTDVPTEPAGIVFQDNFDHDNVSDIVGTTPDTTGISWLELFDDSTTFLTINTATTICTAAASSSNTGILIHANYGPIGSANVEVTATMTNLSNLSDALAHLVARYVDSLNYVTVTMTDNGTEKMRLYKIVAGVKTLLGTSINTPSDGDVIKLQLIGTAWKVFNGEVEEISVTESDLSLAGKSGIGVGDIEDDFSGADVVSANPQFGQFIVEEI